MLVESPEWQNAVLRVCFGLMIMIVVIVEWISDVKDYLKEKKMKNMDGGKNE